MKETALVKKMMDRLKAAGWKCVKIHGGPFQRAGLPDIWCCKQGQLLLIEAKVPGGKATELQKQTLIEWGAAGAFVAVVDSMAKLELVISEAEVEMAQWR